MLGSIMWPADFNMRYTVSTLAGGPIGYYQRINFFVSGWFLMLYVRGLRSVLSGMKGEKAVSVLFLLAGIGLIGSGVFPTNMPGEPVTTNAYIHYGCAMLLFLSLPIACSILIRRFREFRYHRMLVYSQWSWAGVLLFFVLMICGIVHVPGMERFTGLFQRLSIGIGFAWVAVLSVFLLREAR